MYVSDTIRVKAVFFKNKNLFYIQIYYLFIYLKLYKSTKQYTKISEK